MVSDSAMVPLKQFYREIVQIKLIKCLGKNHKVSLNPKKNYTSVHAQQTNNILTNSSESNPYSLIQFLHSRLSSLAGPGLLPIQVGGL